MCASPTQVWKDPRYSAVPEVRRREIFNTVSPCTGYLSFYLIITRSALLCECSAHFCHKHTNTHLTIAYNVVGTPMQLHAQVMASAQAAAAEEQERAAVQAQQVAQVGSVLKPSTDSLVSPSFRAFPSLLLGGNVFL